MDSKQKVEIIPSDAAERLMGREIDISLVSVIILGGDRMACCDEAVVLRTERGDLVGMATISPKGESGAGMPAIVGLYVLPRFRRQGYAKEILLKAIERCVERGFEKVRLDVMSQRMMRVVEKLPAEIKMRLVVNDQSEAIPIDRMAEMER